MCIWCYLMLSDKGLKLQWGGASTVGRGFFSSRGDGYSENLCVYVCSCMHVSSVFSFFWRCKDMHAVCGHKRFVSVHANQTKVNLQVHMYWQFHRFFFFTICQSNHIFDLLDCIIFFNRGS